MAARLGWVDAVSGAPSFVGRALRQILSPSLAGATAARPLGGISGVRPGTPASIVTASSTAWTVTPFAGVIDLEAAAIAGPYPFAFDTNQTGTVTAAGGTARVDSLYVQVSDPTEDGSSTPGIAVGYQANSVTPPARAFIIAQINVPATGGGSPTVSWVAPYTVAAGGILPVPTGTYPAASYAGQYVDDAALGLLRSNGTAWNPAWQSGRAELKYTGAGISAPNGTSTAITFDASDYFNYLTDFTYSRSTGVLTCARAGTYRLELSLVWGSNATGIRQLILSKAVAATPTTYVTQSTYQVTAASVVQAQSAVWCITLAVGDNIQTSGAQNSGGALGMGLINLGLSRIA